MLVVAGLSLRNLQPRVWDASSPFFLANLKAVMVSYADFHQLRKQRTRAMDQGLRAFLGLPDGIRVYLDNGSFYFLRAASSSKYSEYEEFVEHAKPDWWPIPRDFIPVPRMTAQSRRRCFEKTMKVNRQYDRDGFVPVLHIGSQLDNYIKAITSSETLRGKGRIAMGGIVPNLLRAPKALTYSVVLDSLRRVRATFVDRELHVFGIGGTSTLHLAALFGIDSVDSSGWRNRAARGIVQLPGCGDRSVANLGSWRGRTPSHKEWRLLKDCRCPACAAYGIEGLKANGLAGFSCRATHNLSVLLGEAGWLSLALEAGEYKNSFANRLDNSVYLPLIRCVLQHDAEASSGKTNQHTTE